VVLYDALANEELLSYAPKKHLKYLWENEKVHMNIRKKINQLIMHLRIWKCSSVKGGDPFILVVGAKK
jgi:uroporphyrin-III C-methyltransferase